MNCFTCLFYLKSIQRSKKAKEYQLLVEENEGLLTRLHTQEEDFKLQNKTLLDEIANVCGPVLLILCVDLGILEY